MYNAGVVVAISKVVGLALALKVAKNIANVM
jgi:hypothetical protein